jgi:hypothetical protein
VLPTQDLSGLPSPARAAIRAGYDSFLQQDRGSVRAANDGTLDTRAYHFGDWLLGIGIQLELLSRLSQEQAVALIGTYLRCVNAGDSCKGQRNLMEKTLGGYARSAATFWKIATGGTVSPPIFLPHQPGSKATMHPFLADILQQRRNWKAPKQKREPFTYPMFQALATLMDRLARQDGTIFLSVDFAVLDWTRLGVHTGSRLAEYGQSKPDKRRPFATVPNSREAGEWAGTPIAFIRADFIFYDAQMVCREFCTCLERPDLAQFVHIRFRFDKSVNNFTIRKFQRVSGSLLCPVKAALSILKRADRLGIPSDFPIGAFRPAGAATGQYAFLQGDHVCSVMQKACRMAYPDPNHYMRKHIALLQSHSNRITAAVALYNAGETEEVIAFRLRWSVETVRFYLRECFKVVGPLTEQAIRGATLS